MKNKRIESISQSAVCRDYQIEP